MAGISQLPENISTYTELRESANSILSYASFASLSDLLDAKVAVTAAAGGSTTEDARVCEKLLGNSEPIPDADTALALVGPLGTIDAKLRMEKIDPFSSMRPANGEGASKKSISLVQHAAQSKVDYSTSLTDISALFCSMIPPIEMSLCAPYFDVRITYPQDAAGNGQLSALRFLGFRPMSVESSLAAGITSGYIASDMTTKFGFDVAGMEIFSMPQTLADSTANMNSASAISDRGVTILDPLVPLLTIESANIQQTGVGGSLYAQTKVDLKMILHDRSRLSDIEPLVSAEIFPTTNFRITYGWSHPDNNKMTGNVFAKLLNAMRVTQNFAIQNVSLSTRDATSMSISVSLISTGSFVSKSAKVLSANGRFVPYAMVLTLAKQLINIKKSRTDDASSTRQFTRVGTTIQMSTSDASSASRFVKAEDFYSLYDYIRSISTRNSIIDQTKLNELIVKLNNTDVQELEPQAVADELSAAVNFVKAAATEYGSIGTFNHKVFIPEALRAFVGDVSAALGEPFPNESPPTLIPLYDAIAQLVAKPILISQPDVAEVRIHCFSFNSACGEMAEENIGNFPIYLSDLVQKEKNGPGITARSSAETALSTILKQVNNPASNFFGMAALLQKRDEAIKTINESTSTDSEALDAAIAQSMKNAEALIEARNSGILKRKKINFVDAAFVPPRVKSTIDTLDAYDRSNNILDKKIVRIVIYDDRSGGFNKLGNIIFSMINSNGFAKVLSESDVDTSIFTIIEKSKAPSGAPELATLVLRDKNVARQIAMNLYPNLLIGAEGSLVTNASYSSQAASDVGSGYLLSALQDSSQGSSTGASSAANLVDDVLVIPSSITLSMAGNTCITRGQTYCVDFGTGTTLDNSYTVQSVSHSIRPGSFTTSATLVPTNNATMRSVARQLDELKKTVTGS